MSRNKKVKEDDGYEYEKTIWKDNGVEQKKLDEMFSKGLITEKDSYKDIRESEPLFQKFSPQVFNAHFRKTKNKFANIKVQTATETNCVASKTVSELSSSRQILYDYDSIQSKFINSPVFKWNYFDYEDRCTKVCVAAAIIAGASDIKFEIAEDGYSVIIEYAWPTTIFRVQELFESDMKDKGNEMNNNHPRVLAMISELLKTGITEKSVPKGKIEVPLLIKVHTEPGTWKKFAVKGENESRIVLLELRGYMLAEVIDEADTSINF